MALDLCPSIFYRGTDISARRQSTTDKAESALKPDSEKSTLEKAQDSVKSTADSVAGSAQPGMHLCPFICIMSHGDGLLTFHIEGEKGVGQQVSDTVSGTGTGSGEQGQGVLAQAQEAAGNAANTVKDTLGLGESAYFSYFLDVSVCKLTNAAEKA